MNGECKSWNMNKPMTWAEFREMPDDLKGNYIKMLRHRFNVPDKYIAEMLGVARSHLCLYFRDLHLGQGKESGGSHRNWDRKGFEAWYKGEDLNKAETEVTDVEFVNETSVEETTVDIIPETPVESAEQEIVKEPEPIVQPSKLVPNTGSMTFTAPADKILETIKDILGNTNVRMSITWSVVKEE